MLATPPLRRAARAILVPGLAVGALLAGGCGKVEADRGAIQDDLGKAYGAYTAYVSSPSQRGAFGPSTPTTDPALAQAAKAAKYTTLALEAARAEAAPDVKFASFAQKTAAASASLNAVTQALQTGRASRALTAGGLASLESLLASGRDLGLKVKSQEPRPEQLSSPPVP